MPSDQLEKPEGYRIFRGDYIADKGRPLVVVAWSRHSGYGDEILYVEYFVVLPTAPVMAKFITQEMRYVHPAEAKAAASRTFCALALEHATHELEKSANQSVNLDEIDDDQFRLLAQREGYAEKLVEMRQRIRGGPLNQLFYRLEEWFFKNRPFEEVTARR